MTKPVSARPLGKRIQPWARSSAWMWGFSSTQSTTAFYWGGFTYRPTTSAALRLNSGSVLTQPAFASLKLDVVLAHHPPDLVLAHIAQVLGQKPPVPTAVAFRHGFIERFEDSLFALGVVFAAPFSRTLLVSEPGDPRFGKTPQPFTYARLSGSHFRGDLFAAESLRSQKNHCGPLNHTLFALGASHPT